MATYELGSKLGEGAMGVVYHALQRPLEREVAVKFMHVSAEGDPELVRRFRREIEACVRLSHPNIIKIYDAGEMDGKIFLAMEYLSRALPLEEVIKREGPLELSRSLHILNQVLDALEYCHSLGMVHRDIKPANIMVSPGDEVTVMDFGLVRQDGASLLTGEGRAMGSPCYMAPEAFMDSGQGPSVDLWAVGAVFYEMLARRKAFTSSNLPAIVEMILSQEPLSLSEIRPDLPPSLDGFLRRFLAKDPKRRVSCAREALELTRETCEDLAIPCTLETPRSKPAKAGFVPAQKPGKAIPVLGSLAVLSLAVLSSWLAWGRAPTPGPAVVPSLQEVTPSIRELVWSVGSDRVSVRFHPTRASSFHLGLLESIASPQERGHQPSQRDGEVRLDLTGLEPGKSYNIALTDAGGNVLATRAVRTISISEAIRGVTGALQKLDSPRMVRRMTHEILKVHPSVHPEMKEDHRLLLETWRVRLESRVRWSGLEEAVEPYVAVRDSWWGGGGEEASSFSRFYEQICELTELEVAAALNGISMPVLSTRLYGERYRQVESSVVPGDNGFVLLFSSDGESKNPYEERILEAAECQKIHVNRGTFFQSFADPAAGGPLGTVELGSGFYIHGDPIRVPSGSQRQSTAPDRAEIRAVLHDVSPGVGFKILIAPSLAAPPEEWNLLAWIRPRDREPHLVCHALPAKFLGSSPFYMKLELSVSHSWYLNTPANHEQIGYLRSLQVVIPGESDTR